MLETAYTLCFCITALFSRPLFGYCHNVSSLCLSLCLSVTWVYCDKMAEAKIAQFSLKTSCSVSEFFVWEVWWRNSTGSPHSWSWGWGLRYGVVINYIFHVYDTVSRKWKGHNCSLIGNHIWTFNWHQINDLEWPWTVEMSMQSLMTKN